ncbi:hypothetical protein V1509DRAFT_636706 [Lipomyces kononenkoae]
MPYIARWGIVATGWISERFFVDLLVDPASRGVGDVLHKPFAVASRSLASAEKFIASHGNGTEGIKAYGSYDELFADPDVDIVYVGTPHSAHYEVSLSALKAGKHVLCEKIFTVNAAQARHLAEYAKSRHLFIMEAVWVRFFPLALELRKKLHEEKVIGNIRRVTAELAHTDFPNSASRLFDPLLAGGALFDIGVYPMTWIQLICYHHPENKKSPPSKVTSCMLKTSSGVDESTVITMVWDAPQIVSVATCSFAFESPQDCAIRVQGDLGELIIPRPAYRPTAMTVKLYKNENIQDESITTYNFPIPGPTGLFWEADAVARDIRDGKIVDELCSVEETVFVMELLDLVRQQNDLKYPDEIECLKEL